MKKHLLPLLLAVAFTACNSSTTKSTVTTNGETVSTESHVTTVAETKETPRVTLTNPDGKTLSYTLLNNGQAAEVAFEGKNISMNRDNSIEGERYTGEGYIFDVSESRHTLMQNGNTLFNHVQ